MSARRLLAVALSLMITAPAWAQGTGVAPRRVVSVAVIGPAEDTRVLEATIKELLSRLQLTMVGEKNAPASALLETVVIDLTGTYGTKVVVRNARGDTVLDRTIPRGDTPEIQREQIAHAVRGAAEAELLEDEDRVAGRAPPVVTPAPAPPPAPVDPPPPVAVTAPVITSTTAVPNETGEPKSPKAASPLALEVSMFAGGGLFANDSLVARVGGSVALASRRGWRPSITLSALYAFPFEMSDNAPTEPPDTLSTQAHLFSLRAMPGLSVWQTKRFGIDVAAGGGVDVMSVNRPSSGTLPDSALGPATTRADWVFAGAVTGRLALASDVALTLSAVLDMDPSSRTYVFDDRGHRDEILSPWQFRPMLLAGLSFTALGAPR